MNILQRLIKSQFRFTLLATCKGTKMDILFSTVHLISQMMRFMSSITEITTVSPLGVYRSELAPYESVVGQWYVNITWTPTLGQYGPNIFCFTAVDSTG